MHIRSTEIAEWIRSRVTAAGARGIVVGLTGDLDSAVVAGLCRAALADRAIALLMCEPADAADARGVAEHFGLAAAAVDLDAPQAALSGALHAAFGPSEADARPDGAVDPAEHAASGLQARLRMASLYYVANTLNYLVAGALNRCDLTVGAFRKHGDGAADLFPVGHLLASEVRALAVDLDLPGHMVQKPAAAGGRHAEDADRRVTYDDVERYLSGGPEAVPPAMALRIERLIRNSAHKRAPVITPDPEF